jgi:hypothetical protein
MRKPVQVTVDVTEAAELDIPATTAVTVFLRMAARSVSP